MYEIFEQLLLEFNMTAYQVAKATGISQSTLSNWKSRRNHLSPEKLQKIADYFHVTMDYMMTGLKKDESEKYYLNDDTAKMAQDIFDNKELRLLFDAARNAEPEDLKVLHNMLLALKRKEQHYNDN